MVALLKEVLENRAIQGSATNGKKNVISETWHRLIMQLLNSTDLYRRSCKWSPTKSVPLPASNGHEMKMCDWWLCGNRKEEREKKFLFLWFLKVTGDIEKTPDNEMLSGCWLVSKENLWKPQEWEHLWSLGRSSWRIRPTTPGSLAAFKHFCFIQWKLVFIFWN